MSTKRKFGRNNVLYGFHRNTNGASIAINKVDKPKRSNSATIIKKKVKSK